MHIISIHSQKGGTGKTSIALSIVLELFRRGKKPLLVDADLSGTSIRDMIHLKDGLRPDQSIINYFKSPQVANPLDYIALAEITDTQQNLVRELPVVLGDPESADRIMPLVYKESHSFYLRSRFERLINDLFIGKKTDVIVIDNSPGAWGIAKAILETVNSGTIRDNDAVKFVGKALLVSSADLNDISSCIRKISEPSSTFLHILNKAPHQQNIDQNVNVISANLDQKSKELKNTVYQVQAQTLRAKKFAWCAAEEPHMSKIYHSHTKGMSPISNISVLLNSLGL